MTMALTGQICIQAAIDRIEEQLVSPNPRPGADGATMRVSELAAHIGYSVHHFSRLFSALVGVPPGPYILGRSLSVAAGHIVNSERSLASIAFDCGFANYEVFSRAFKRQFGIGPRMLRRQPGTLIDLVPPCVLPPPASGAGLVDTEPVLVEEDGHELIGLAFWMDGSEKSFHRPWAIFQGQAGLVKGASCPRRWYQHAAWPSGDGMGMSILCALEIDPAQPGAHQSPLFTTRRIPAGSYLRFRHCGPLEQLAATYQFIYGQWLANSEYQLCAGWEFQRFGDDPSGPLEICLPLEPPPAD